jgi:hypothetical protein
MNSAQFTRERGSGRHRCAPEAGDRRLPLVWLLVHLMAPIFIELYKTN